jgi:putative ABC transport system ATP-binding protein
VNKLTKPNPPTGTSPEVPVVDVSGVRFKWRRQDPFELSIPSFTISPRERVLLIGPSGSGKSTFLSLLCGIAIPQAGDIRIMGTSLTSIAGTKRDRFRADHLGIIFQMFNLVPYLSCLENVLLPLGFSPKRTERAGGKAAAPAEARRLLDRLGLDPEIFANQAASRMSVGQQQRVAAARALIGRPELIIADEPTSSLDRDLQLAFVGLLQEEVAAAGAALLMVSHDMSLSPMFDRVVPLAEITQRGTVAAAA